MMKNCRKCGVAWIALVALISTILINTAVAETEADEDSAPVQGLLGPDDLGNRLESDAAEKANLLKLHGSEDWDAWKKRLQDNTGLQFAADYTSVGYWADNDAGVDNASGGTFRLYGRWDLLGRGTKNSGGLAFKVENRHSYTDVPVADFGVNLGYAGFLNPLLTDQGTRITHLYWRQSFSEGKSVIYGGWLDITDYTDVYALASPWTDFSNLVFSTGAGTVSTYPDGSLGLMGTGFLTDHVYVVASIVDANSDPTGILGGVDTFFDEFETLKTLEFGVVPGLDQAFLKNMHITAWQIDEREEANTPDGWGLNFSASGLVAQRWFPFLRAGWAKDGATLYEASVSTGVGFKPSHGHGFLGAAVNWSRPNEDTFGARLDNQYTTEIYYRMQLTQKLQLTPSIQFVKDPALDPEKNSIVAYGLRFRVTI